MNRSEKISKRFSDLPHDRPHREGCEHANMERPGARAHPRAANWSRLSTGQTTGKTTGWRLI